MSHPTYYRTTQIDGLKIFYREAGPKDAPTLLLLHGLPTSSRQFEPLFARLSDRYHLLAPRTTRASAKRLAESQEVQLHLRRHRERHDALYGTAGPEELLALHARLRRPGGFRMILAHPERIQSLIIQDAAGHDEGLGANWKKRREFWEKRTENEPALRENLLSLETTRRRHVGDDPDVERYDPDLWTEEFRFLNAPGQADIQSDLFYDYRTNVASYPEWQEWMRKEYAAPARRLGKARPLVRPWRARALPQGRAGRRGPRARRGTFCPRHEG